MNYLINQLMTVDKAFYRHYLEMLLTLNRIQALTPWQMSMLLWRAKIFHIQVLYPELLRISLCTEQEKDEIRFMKGWKLKELEKIMPAWQRRQCEEIRRERWRGFCSNKTTSCPLRASRRAHSQPARPPPTRATDNFCI